MVVVWSLDNSSLLSVSATAATCKNENPVAVLVSSVLRRELTKQRCRRSAEQRGYVVNDLVADCQFA